MDSQISFRPIVEGDRETLYRCYASTRTEELSVVPWDDEAKDRFLRMQFHAQSLHYEKHYPRAQFQLILVDEQPAGRLYVDRWEKEIRIVDITLLPPFRGQGIGSSILDSLIEESAAAGKPLSIHVEKNNPAMRLYERLGFRPIGEVGVYDLMERSV
ncbi:MAG: GNAT family N-acetyltransferase [Candidatus Saccharimonas sp.]|nr:GNAT family N-acetyltransferase [Planctomycetaceae bacterium]